MSAMSVAAGVPQLAGIVSPTLFSALMTQKFYQASTITKIANTDYEGEISDQGSKVTIRQINDATINPYVKGGTTVMQWIQPSTTDLEINKGSYFYGRIDSVDKFQSDLDYVEKFAEDGVWGQKKYVDDDVFANIYADAAAANKGATAGSESGDIDLGSAGSPLPTTSANVLELIVERAGVVCDEENMPEENRWIVLPAWMAGKIKTSDLKNASLTGDSKSILRSGGRIGMIDRFEIFSTNSIKAVTDGSYKGFHCIFGHRSSLAFALQFTETQYFDKLEQTAGQAVRSIQVYGYKTLLSKGIGDLYVRKG